LLVGYPVLHDFLIKQFKDRPYADLEGTWQLVGFSAMELWIFFSNYR
jgi:hypothetical protein